MKNTTRVSSGHTYAQEASGVFSGYANSFKTSIRPARLLIQRSTMSHAVLMSYTYGRLSFRHMIPEEIPKLFHSLLTWWMFRLHNATQHFGPLGHVTGHRTTKDAYKLELNGKQELRKSRHAGRRLGWQHRNTLKGTLTVLPCP